MLSYALRLVQGRILRAVGDIGAVKLAVISAFRSPDKHAYNIETTIKCRGETYHGDIPFSQMVKDGLFTLKEGLGNKIIHVAEMSIDHVALVFPYLPMMWVLEHKAQQRYQFVNSVPGIKSNLPLELQYLQAAALPLFRRTCIAHINFTAQVLKSRDVATTFQHHVYRDLMSLAHVHAMVPGVVPMLKQLEIQIEEFNHEEKSVEAWYRQQCHSDPIKYLHSKNEFAF